MNELNYILALLTFAITCVGGHLWKKASLFVDYVARITEDHTFVCIVELRLLGSQRVSCFLGWYWARCRNTHKPHLFHQKADYRHCYAGNKSSQFFTLLHIFVKSPVVPYYGCNTHLREESLPAVQNISDLLNCFHMYTDIFPSRLWLWSLISWSDVTFLPADC